MGIFKLESKTLSVIVISLIVGLIGGFLSSWLLQKPSSTQKPNFDNIIQATVTIRTRKKIGESQISEQIGTGLVVKSGGYLITNFHLVKGANEIIVRASDSKESSAKVIKKDENKDLAILKVNSPKLKIAKLGSDTDIGLGEKVFVLGKPSLNLNNYTITSGIVSSLPVNLPKGSPRLLQVDAIINPGNSGGPIINESGKVIAIATAYLSTGDNVSGIGFAIPVDTVMSFVNKSL